MNPVARYVFNRLNELSAIRGIVGFICGIVGWQLSTDQTETIVSFAMATMGLIALLFPDRFNRRSRKTDYPIESGSDPKPPVLESAFSRRVDRPLPPVENGESDSELGVEAEQPEIRRFDPDSRASGWPDRK